MIKDGVRVGSSHCPALGGLAPSVTNDAQIKVGFVTQKP